MRNGTYIQRIETFSIPRATGHTAYTVQRYPQSPESGQIVSLNFPCFNLLAREFVLEENRQKKQDERHRDSRAMEDIDPNENKALARSVDDELLRRELWAAMEKSTACLTAPQRQRIRMYVENVHGRRTVTL